MIKIAITGGAGFIGSHVVRQFVKKYPQYHIFNIDNLTYAGNLENIKEIAAEGNYTFLKGDIVDKAFVSNTFKTHQFDAVIHLAAESHVDRSIETPTNFAMTNIIGTINLLEAAKECWNSDFENKLFYHISTDEVYGSLGINDPAFTETTNYDPHSPYSASKAAADHMVKAYHDTYRLPIVISNCSNNYGPNQYPEKLIPVIINSIVENKPIPVYGKGENIRDWLYVEDHAEAIDLIFHKGKNGETYNVGGLTEWKNIDLVKKICIITEQLLERSEGSAEKLITFVTDRLGHDKRYAININKIKTELGWNPSTSFEKGLEKTIAWYLNQCLEFKTK